MLNFRKKSRLLLGLTIAALAACSTPGPQLDAAQESSETILLVSREDGSIVRQTVNLDADICIKAISSATTTCLVQGDAVVNMAGVVVGHEMQETTIELEALH